ncbi:hypothetical protein BDR03DRAFT_1016953 [Suillus americanus]|nr:hypothetical protein BDR03DRAFT_1016953 [Suillus americanus]
MSLAIPSASRIPCLHEHCGLSRSPALIFTSHHNTVLALPMGQTEGDDEKKERRWQLIKRSKDKADSQAAEVARLKKEMQEQSEIERQKELKWSEEIERQKELKREHLEHEHLECERLECEHLECKHLECERLESKQLEREHVEQHRLKCEHLHQEPPKANQCAQAEHVMPDDSMDIDIKPGK